MKACFDHFQNFPQIHSGVTSTGEESNFEPNRVVPNIKKIDLFDEKPSSFKHLLQSFDAILQDVSAETIVE